jgi:hypothetical protein
MMRSSPARDVHPVRPTGTVACGFSGVSFTLQARWIAGFWRRRYRRLRTGRYEPAAIEDRG